jgi:hypothetical protein
MTAARARAGVDDMAASIAANLAGAPVRRLTQLGGGRNSRVFRVETALSFFALKLYPAADDGRDRLGVETAVLRWMEAQAITIVPRLIAADHRLGAALLSWVDGDLVYVPGAADVSQACAFLRLLHERRDRSVVPRGQLAAEACLSGVEIERQLRARLAMLLALRDTALTEFLDGEAAPALAARIARARAELASAGGCFDTQLPDPERSQVPADFGFHNALRRENGQLTFIDFEYFGWDDPAKLIGDLLLHPGTALDDGLRVEIFDTACGIYASRNFAARLAALLPMLGLRWALILLNEFFPERWRRRVAAAGPGLAGVYTSWEDAKRRQLQAARKMLTRHIIPGVVS